MLISKVQKNTSDSDALVALEALSNVLSANKLKKQSNSNFKPGSIINLPIEEWGNLLDSNPIASTSKLLPTSNDEDGRRTSLKRSTTSSSQFDHHDSTNTTAHKKLRSSLPSKDRPSRIPSNRFNLEPLDLTIDNTDDNNNINNQKVVDIERILKNYMRNLNRLEIIDMEWDWTTYDNFRSFLTYIVKLFKPILNWVKDYLHHRPSHSNIPPIPKIPSDYIDPLSGGFSSTALRKIQCEQDTLRFIYRHRISEPSPSPINFKLTNWILNKERILKLKDEKEVGFIIYIQNLSKVRLLNSEFNSYKPETIWYILNQLIERLPRGGWNRERRGAKLALEKCCVAAKGTITIERLKYSKMYSEKGWINI